MAGDALTCTEDQQGEPQGGNTRKKTGATVRSRVQDIMKVGLSILALGTVLEKYRPHF